MIAKLKQRIQDWRLARRYRRTGGRLPNQKEQVALYEWAMKQKPRKLNL